MSRRANTNVVPRNGHTLVVGIVARISGCASQKEMSLDDQVDHGKEEVAELYEGPCDYRIVATKGKGERLDRPELAEVERMIRTRELDLLVMEDVGRLIRGTDAVRLWGIAVDRGVRCIAPNDCIDTIDESWEEDLISACRDHVGHNAHTSKRLKKKLVQREIVCAR
jgi:site-specific DNA recombinase